MYSWMFAWFSLALGLVGVGLAADGTEDAIGKERKELDGTWVVESIVRDPAERGPDEGKGIRCVIAGEKVVAKLPGEDKPVGGLLIRIDATKKPKALDLWPDESPFGKSVEATFKEPPLLAIYELEGDTLRVCCAPVEKRERPAEFAAKPGSGHSLFVLKREKR
jgi:uncharacterized protein (TIGR03067 family)